jgi:hypothetical protein
MIFFIGCSSYGIPESIRDCVTHFNVRLSVKQMPLL